jgi:hypothetical protein
VKLYDALRRMVVLRVERTSWQGSAHLDYSGRGAYSSQAEPIEMDLRVAVYGDDAREAFATFMTMASSVRGLAELMPAVSPSDALDDLLRRDHAGVTAILRELSPDELARLTVAVDAAQSGRSLAKYRSPADVDRIAELEAELGQERP